MSEHRPTSPNNSHGEVLPPGDQASVPGGIPAGAPSEGLVRRVRRWGRTSGATPTLRILACVARSLAILLGSRLRGLALDGAQRRRARSRATQRVAEHWARLLGSLRGAYAKAGQFAASRPDLVPEEIALPLAKLRDRLPPLPLAEVRPVLEAELGVPLETSFADFRADTLGAASIAQVHRATLPDGRSVAVKVQYPWIESSLDADLRMLRRLVRMLLWWTARGHRKADFERFFGEFSQSLIGELDFEAEARAAGEIAENLSADPNIRVPKIIASHTRKRVLTMEYSPCVNIADRDGLAALGVEPAAVLEIVARAYAKQVFEDGLFHADPHPGNLFVLDEEGAGENPRVLFVDFGLHRRLAPDLQKEMRQGIFALMQRDLDAFMQCMKAMNMIAPGADGPVRSAVQEMLDRIASEGGAGELMSGSGSQVLSLKDEAKRLLEQTPGLQLPDDLLLYAKTLSYLFALGEELDPEVDLMKISVPYLLRFLASRD